MIFKERGITIGEFLLVLIFIISSVFNINKFKENDRQTYIYISPNENITYIKN